MCPKQLSLLDLGEIPKAARGNGCYAGVAGVPEAVTRRRAGCTVHCADVLEWAAEYSGPPFHALLCDPPYELGFMGKDWDRSGIAFDPATWAALSAHLHPGAFGMAFASARGWHRLAVAIEDAGLIIHPSIFGWAYGSGFPKATRIDNQVEPPFDGIWEGHRYGLQALKPALEPVIVFQKPYGRVSSRTIYAVTGWDYWHGRREPENTPAYRLRILRKHGVRIPPPCREYTLVEVRRRALHDGVESDLRFVWEDTRQDRDRPTPPRLIAIVDGRQYREWHTRSPVANQVVTGAGALNIDDTRIRAADNPMRWESPRGGIWRTDGDADAELEEDLRGRWPANLCLEHHPECKRVGTRRVKSTSGSVSGDEPGEPASVYSGRWKRAPYDRGSIEDGGYETVAVWECHPDCPVRRMDAMSGERGADGPIEGKHNGASGGVYNDFAYKETASSYYGDEGGASRFYFNADWSYEVAEQLAAADPARYVPKACRRERDAGLGSRPAGYWSDGRHKAADHPKQRAKTPRRNPHPTVKPISLAVWLATLLLPPPEYAPRRLLVPFAGSGSEVIGAMFAGWDEVLGVELDREHVGVAETRLDWWAQFRSYEKAKSAW